MKMNFPGRFGQLDDYEGMSVEPDEVQLYRREITEVHLNGQSTHAVDILVQLAIPAADL
jgi:hypothetical protein